MSLNVAINQKYIIFNKMKCFYLLPVIIEKKQILFCILT